MKGVVDETRTIRRFLKNRLRRDQTTFYGFVEEFKHIKESLFGVEASNSAILVAPRNCGKTTVTCVLTSEISCIAHCITFSAHKLRHLQPIANKNIS